MVFTGSVSVGDQCCEQRVLPLFNNLVANETCDDVKAEILDRSFILPSRGCFYMVISLFDLVVCVNCIGILRIIFWVCECLFGQLLITSMNVSYIFMYFVFCHEEV